MNNKGKWLDLCPHTQCLYKIPLGAEDLHWRIKHEEEIHFNCTLVQRQNNLEECTLNVIILKVSIHIYSHEKYLSGTSEGLNRAAGPYTILISLTSPKYLFRYTYFLQLPCSMPGRKENSQTCCNFNKEFHMQKRISSTSRI